MNILLLLALATMVLTIARGWRRGILGLIYGVTAWIFITGFVIFANPPIYRYLMYEENVYDRVYSAVYPYVDRQVPGYTEKTGIVEETVRGGAASMPALAGLDELRESYENGELEVPEEYRDLIDNADLNEIKRKIENGEIELPEEYRALIEAGNWEDVLTGEVDPEQTIDLSGILSGGGQGLSDMTDRLRDALEGSVSEVRTEVVEAATEKATAYVLKFAAVVLAYLIAKVIAILAKLLLELVTEQEGIRLAVHVAGAALGAVEGLLYIWVALFGISMLQITDFGKTLYGYVAASPVLQVLYENNVLTNFR